MELTQEIADEALMRCLRDVEALGLSPVGDIEPHVRLTDNRTRLGTCRETTGAYIRGNRRGERILTPGSHPRFLISCTRNVGDVAELLDVMYHEVIHTLPGCFSHGREFKAAAAKVNAAYGCNVTVTRRGTPGDGGRTGRRREEARASRASATDTCRSYTSDTSAAATASR